MRGEQRGSMFKWRDRVQFWGCLKGFFFIKMNPKGYPQGQHIVSGKVTCLIAISNAARSLRFGDEGVCYCVCQGHMLLRMSRAYATCSLRWSKMQDPNPVISELPWFWLAGAILAVRKFTLRRDLVEVFISSFILIFFRRVLLIG